MSESRTKPPVADAAKSGLRRQTNRFFRRGSAARLPQSGHSNRSNTCKSNPVVRCDGVERLTCGPFCRSPMQRNRPFLGGQISGVVAALQHEFPRAVVQSRQNGRYLNRTFAAPVPYVSHVDFPAVRRIRPHSWKLQFARSSRFSWNNSRHLAKLF